MQKIAHPLALALFLFFQQHSHTQDLSWYYQLHATGPDLHTDNSGNLYVKGAFRGNLDFDPGPGESWQNSGPTRHLFLQKLSADRQHQWIRLIGGPNIDSAYAWVALDQHNNSFIAGRFQQTADFDPGPGELLLSAGGTDNQDVFIQKIDPGGALLWVKQLNMNVTPASLDIDAGGNLLLAGKFQGTVDFDPGPGEFLMNSGFYANTFILKLDPDGHFQWVRFFEGELHTIKSDAQQNILALGSGSGEMDLDPGALDTFSVGTPGEKLFYTLKLDSAGIFQWGFYSRLLSLTLLLFLRQAAV